MEKKRIFTMLTKICLMAPLLFVSACKEEARVTSQPISSNETEAPSTYSTNSSQKMLLSNLKVEPDPEAEKIPKLFYQYVTEGKYDEAAECLGPRLQFRGNANLLPYIKNIKKVSFIEMRDITSEPDTAKLIENNYRGLHPEEYYQIKVYYSVLRIEVTDSSLQPGLPGTNYRMMILIRETPNSPWILDTDANTEKRK